MPAERGRGAVPGPGPTLDTLEVAQHHLALRGRASLAECCSHYGLSWADHHSALGDARVTAALFRAMRNQLGDDALGLDRSLARARFSTWPGGSVVAPAVRARAAALTG